jgi:hypothetical protein
LFLFVAVVVVCVLFISIQDKRKNKKKQSTTNPSRVCLLIPRLSCILPLLQEAFFSFFSKIGFFLAKQKGGERHQNHSTVVSSPPSAKKSN